MPDKPGEAMLVAAEVPLYFPFGSGPEAQLQSRHAAIALRELQRASGRLVFNVANTTCAPEIFVKQYRHPKAPGGDTIQRRVFAKLLIGASVPVVPVYAKKILPGGAESPCSSAEAEFWGRRVAVEDFAHNITNLAIVTNWAIPGSLDCAEGHVAADGAGVVSTPRVSCEMPLQSYIVARRLHWPGIRRVSVARAWQWANRNDGFVKGFGGGRVGRALHALSYVLAYDGRSEAVGLLWAILGLEALFGSRGGHQLRDRVEALLGKPEKNKRLLSEVYDLRSRLVHGDEEIPAAHAKHEEEDKFGDAMGRGMDIGLAALIASFHELVRRNWAGIAFETMPRPFESDERAPGSTMPKKQRARARSSL
ncbi:hypothetical protein [Anaeromyxobacter terrae]|uniref:hypothetical protein n=1 Tax=Anaeromyxobacter terrae TaxID=2925406 RepID=UPI001F56A618|nr:hypothetical protein [Anaeromyxobacter sp. SG22]